MIPLAPIKILIGICLDPEESKEILSWVITTLAQPNAHIVAFHVLVKNPKSKKDFSVSKLNSQIRKAKTHVISVLGEFAKASQSKQVNLEAKVGFSSSVGSGLIEEAKSISADYILVRRSKACSNRNPQDIARYCLDHAPPGCALILTPRKNPQAAKKHILDSVNSRRTDNNNAVASRIRTHITTQTNCEKPSPRLTEPDSLEETNRSKPSPRLTEPDSLEEDSPDDLFSLEDDSVATRSPPHMFEYRAKSFPSKSRSPHKFITSLLKRGNQSFSFKDKNRKPLVNCFRYDEISKATKNFHPDNIVGQGGYSEVYRGDLYDGRSIAVKRLTKYNNDPAKEKEFLTELGIIGHVRHPNTVVLIGYCIENGLCLVFDFSQNGNLESSLHGKNSLDWPVRYKIALGVGRGLHYLHKRCKHRIIHRDIKSSNVLLGPDYEPQITDFGLAKWLPNKWSHHAVLPIEGTFGYLAPEYFMHGIVDEKTDVFAFGVLLLEIVTGRRPIDSSKQNLLLWAKPLMESGDIAQLADPKLEDRYDEDQMYRLILTACYCVRQSSIWRPSMNEVLKILSKEHDEFDATKRLRMPKFTSDELDDYSMIFGYEVPIEISLDNSL